MTTNQTTNPTTNSNTKRADSAAKVAAGSAVLFAVSFFLTVAVIDMPHSASDATVLAWWAEPGNISSAVLTEVFAIATAILWIVVVNHVRSLAARVEGGQAWLSFAYSMATAFTATMLVTAATRSVIGRMIDVENDPLPGVDVLRYATNLNIALMGGPVMTVLALAIIGISVVVLRTRILGTWMAYDGLVCGVVILAAVAVKMGQFAIPMALIWALSMAVAILRAPAPSTREISEARQYVG